MQSRPDHRGLLRWIRVRSDRSRRHRRRRSVHLRRGAALPQLPRLSRRSQIRRRTVQIARPRNRLGSGDTHPLQSRDEGFFFPWPLLQSIHRSPGSPYVRPGQNLCRATCIGGSRTDGTRRVRAVRAAVHQQRWRAPYSRAHACRARRHGIGRDVPRRRWRGSRHALGQTDRRKNVDQSTRGIETSGESATVGGVERVPDPAS
mmetsp:Transcript_4560/g.8265  ORF Transcript_4560/g.8265 Transcript_4560/m.8265 type:complete len:203 (+) Transcript_4560:994-1602(+)